MKTRTLLSLGLSVAALGIAAAGFAGTQDAAGIGAKQFEVARAALAKGRIDNAIIAAESAVGYDPQVAAYRVLLGQAYLKAGRFASAQAAFADAVSLDPANGKAALHLALAQIAEGQWDGARKTLDANATTIAVADRGLAMALAGDPAAAVELLSTAARAPEADAKTRQNYALALALAGRWADARTVVGIDLAPDQVDARIMQWASFAKPNSASDQVASLLGVTPVEDPGQPVRLALVQGDTVGLAAAAPIDSFMPGASAAPVAVAVARPVAPPVVAVPEPIAVAASVSNVSFAPRREVIQALPPRVAREVALKRESVPGAVATKLRVAMAPTTKIAPGAAVVAAPAAKGNFYVQLGAYENAAVARDAWGRATRAHAGFAGRSPSGMAISTKGGTFYRLSVGGFARADAVTLCEGYRARGGACFVRAGAGDKSVAWVKPGVKLASR